MHRMIRWALPALFAATALAFSSPSEASEPVNRVGDVVVEEIADQTVIRIVGSMSPTYSVYRLRNPLRLFIDISSSELDGAPARVSVDNGVIDQIATVEYEDALSNVTRVVIGFDVDAHYDVVSDGHDLIVTVDAAGRHLFAGGFDPADDPVRLREEVDAAQARIHALESALAEARQRNASAEIDAIANQLDRESDDLERLVAMGGPEFEQLQAEHNATLGELQRVEASLSDREQALAELSMERAEALQRLEEMQARSGSTEQALAERDADLAQMTAELHRVEEELAEARSVEELRQRWSSAGVAITDVRFEHIDGIDRVVIHVPAGASFSSQPWDDGRASLMFENVSLPDHLRRTLDTQAFDGPVAFISSYNDPEGQVHVVAELQNAASEIIRQEADRIVWEFTSTSQGYDDGYHAGGLTSSPDSYAAGAEGAGTYTSYGDMYSLSAYGGDSQFRRRPRLTRKRITIDLRNADIQNVLRLIADEGNINIVASDDVAGTITLRLRSVPLDEALAIILQSKGLGWQQQGNILRVAPLEVFEAEYERELQRLADSFELEPLQVRLIPVNYATAGDLSGLVGGVLSSRGSVAVDGRNNLLVVTDIFNHLETAEMLVDQLDNQTPQILIEARIVETNDQFRRQLGIQWGGSFIADQSLGNATGLLFPSTIGIAGGASDAQTPSAGTVSAPNFGVNLPAPAGTGSGGAIGFTFGNLAGSLNLNVRLSAAESQGSAKVISAPRIMTLDNQPASITSGVSIPVSVVSAAGAQTVFFDASLTLNVTPRVTPDGNIFLDVQVSKNEPDFENTGARGDPSIIRREASTQLLVRDGETTVIGGIFQRNTGFSRDSVPFLGALPVIGPLFRNSSRTDVRNELLVFITPRIVNRDLSIDRMGTGDDIMTPRE